MRLKSRGEFMPLMFCRADSATAEPERRNQGGRGGYGEGAAHEDC